MSDSCRAFIHGEHASVWARKLEDTPRRVVERAALQKLTGFRTLKPGRLGRLTAGAPGAMPVAQVPDRSDSAEHQANPPFQASEEAERRFKKNAG